MLYKDAITLGQLITCKRKLPSVDDYHPGQQIVVTIFIFPLTPVTEDMPTLTEQDLRTKEVKFELLLYKQEDRVWKAWTCATPVVME